MQILLVEDDEKLNQALAFQLKREGFAVDCCLSGDEALYFVHQNIYDLILLDRMIPGLSGTEVLARLRREQDPTPVILITALGTLDDKVAGLELGADDYLVKPFDFEELNARIRCILRRPRQMTSSGCLTVGDISYDVQGNRLSGSAAGCSLSRREGALLETFLRNPGQTLPRPLLLSRVWGLDNDVEDGNLDNYIHFLRRRLKAVGSRIRIQTVRGVGYRIDP